MNKMYSLQIWSLILEMIRSLTYAENCPLVIEKEKNKFQVCKICF